MSASSAERQARYRARQREKLAQAVTPVTQAAPIIQGSDRMRQRLADAEAECQRLHDRLLTAESEILRLKARQVVRTDR